MFCLAVQHPTSHSWNKSMIFGRTIFSFSSSCRINPFKNVRFFLYWLCVKSWFVLTGPLIYSTGLYLLFMKQILLLWLLLNPESVHYASLKWPERDPTTVWLSLQEAQPYYYSEIILGLFAGDSLLFYVSVPLCLHPTVCVSLSAHCCQYYAGSAIPRCVYV